MERVGLFSKVSLAEFSKAFKNGPVVDRDRIAAIYNEIKEPVRATSGSGGYDFHAPYYIKLEPDEAAVIPTGIRANIDEGWSLDIYPRSSLGFKYNVVLANTVGIIDTDYYYSQNEGHIFIKIINRGDKTLEINAGDRFAQGKFTPYGITKNDNATSKRNGGMGSTGV